MKMFPFRKNMSVIVAAVWLHVVGHNDDVSRVATVRAMKPKLPRAKGLPKGPTKGITKRIRKRKAERRCVASDADSESSDETEKEEQEAASDCLCLNKVIAPENVVEEEDKKVVDEHGPPVALACGDKLHVRCANRWMQTRNLHNRFECPYCRARQPANDIVAQYNAWIANLKPEQREAFQREDAEILNAPPLQQWTIEDAIAANAPPLQQRTIEDAIAALENAIGNAAEVPEPNEMQQRYNQLRRDCREKLNDIDVELLDEVWSLNRVVDEMHFAGLGSGVYDDAALGIAPQTPENEYGHWENVSPQFCDALNGQMFAKWFATQDSPIHSPEQAGQDEDVQNEWNWACDLEERYDKEYQHLVEAATKIQAFFRSNRQ
jgi:hypothetical protein